MASTWFLGIGAISVSADADTAFGPHAAAYPALNASAHWIATGFEVAGVLAILLVGLAASVRFVRRAVSTSGGMDALSDYRADLGRGVLLGLELLVAADIVGTVAIAPTFSNLCVLAIVILVRTFLSISLGVEIEGQWPWKRREADRDSLPRAIPGPPRRADDGS